MVFAGCGNKPSDIEETKAGELAEAASQPSVPPETEVQYTAKKGLQTILVMGLDKFELKEEKKGYLNDQQNDFLMLLILDEKNQVCDILHLNRDTMTEIRRLGLGGGEAGKFEGQLALAHTYGSGGSDSCLNTTKAVSKLLKGVKIDHYIAMTMAGVSKLNDLVGGVEVTIPVDMTNVIPDWEKGKTVTLQGEEALLFVRSRMSVGDGSNLSRMERQRTYLSAFHQKLVSYMKEDHSFLSKSLLEMSSEFQSDLSINQLSALGDVMENCEIRPFTTIDGEAVVGEEFMEFYLDEESLNSTLIKLFCE